DLETFIFENFPDVRAHVSRLGGGGTSANPIAIRISGKDTDKLYRIVNSVKEKLVSLNGTKNIKDDWDMRSKKLIVNIDQTRAQLAGLTSQDIAVSLYTILSGAQTGQYREDDKTIPIIMRNDQATEEMSIEQLETLNIFSQATGNNVPLSQVATIDVAWQPSRIMRRDLNKTFTITADLKSGFTAQDIMQDFTRWLDDYHKSWGAGYTYNLGGEAEDSSKAMGAVSDKLPLSFFIILLLLIGQFNSMRKTFIVLSTIPLGIIGVVIGLLVANSYFGFMAFLGIISLAGIVINNAIVLLDRIDIEIREVKRPPKDAIIAAAQQRFRPILLTTFTTSLGLIPLWVGGGVMWQPMAISIIFGLLFATVITLLFVPALYRMLYRISYKGFVGDEEYV
nr:efflux RND transporter permease subunit [Bacteroidota bacterium]